MKKIFITILFGLLLAGCTATFDGGDNADLQLGAGGTYPTSIPSYSDVTASSPLTGHAADHNALHTDVTALATKIGTGASNSSGATSGYVLTADGSGGSSWLVAAASSGGISDINSSQLGQLTDVSTTTLGYGYLISWSGSDWNSIATSTLKISYNDLINVPAAVTGVGALGDLSDVATTTAGLGNLLSLQSNGTYDNVATSTLKISYNDLTNAPSLFSGSWDDLTSKAATSTILALLDSDKRISTLNATTTNIDSLRVYNSVSTTAASSTEIYVSDHISIGTEQSFHSLNIGGVSAMINSNYSNSDACIWFGNVASGEDSICIDNWDSNANYFNDTGQTLVVSDDLYIDGRLKTNGNLYVTGSATTTGSHYVGGDLKVIGRTDLVNVYVTDYNATGDIRATGSIFATSTIFTDSWLRASSVTTTNSVDASFFCFSGANCFNSVFSGSWDSLTSKPATSTILSLLDSDYRIAWLNASNTANFLNINAYGSASTTDSLYVGGYASSTGGFFTKGNSHIGGTFTVDGNATTSGNLVVGKDSGTKKACLAMMSSTGAWTYMYFNGTTQVISASSCVDSGSNSTTTVTIGQ